MIYDKNGIRNARTYDGQELDLVEEREGKLLGCEFKWSGKRKLRPPRAWLAAYSKKLNVTRRCRLFSRW